jgi:bacterial/archaeal transporter family-2 protein
VSSAKVFIPITFLVGSLTAWQARANGELAVLVGSGLEAAVWSFGSGLIMLTILFAVNRRIRAGVGKVVRGLRNRDFPRWHILGGVLGGTFVGVQASVVPLIGVALFTVAVVAGQSSNALLVDRIGLGPAGVAAISPIRVIASALAVGGVLVAVSNRLSGEVSVLPVALSFLVGALISVQQAINGRIGITAGNAFSSTWFNFVFGTTALIVASATQVFWGDMYVSALPSDSWWVYTGGIVGVVYIAMSVWVVPKVGVLIFVLISVSGQLTGALILDLLMPTSGTVITPTLFIGVGLTFVAVVLSILPRLLRKTDSSPRSTKPTARN